MLSTVKSVSASNTPDSSSVLTDTTTVAWVIPGIYDATPPPPLHEQAKLITQWLLTGVRNTTKTLFSRRTVVHTPQHTFAPSAPNSWSAFRASIRRGGGGGGGSNQTIAKQSNDTQHYICRYY